jgi:hypothetical protein
MGRISSTLTAVCAATLLTASVATAQGTIADRKTIVTFSGPVSLPGTTIPAGSYVFKLADSPADRHIVMVFDKEEAKLITTLLAVPAQRNEAHGDPVVSFKETPSDRPPAVRYWYYAGEKDGNEFIYPRAQAMMIAQASGETVQSFDTDSTDMSAWKSGKVSTTTSTSSSSSSTASTTSASTSTQSATSTVPEPAPATPTPTASTTSASTSTQSATSTTPTTAPAPTATAPTTAPTEPVVSTAPVTPEPTTAPAPAPATAPPVTAQPEPVGTSGRSELPKTSSSLPVFGQLGAFALAGALVTRMVRRSLA